MNRPSVRDRDRAGVTLLELILVMMILAVVLGGGLGLFAALDLGRDQALGLVKSVLRTAQNAALTRAAPARVRFDREARSLRAEALQVIGTWQFEGDRIEGAFGLDGDALGATFVEDGYLGSALSFRGRRDDVLEIPVQRDPAFDLSLGFAVELVLRRQEGAGWILRLGRSVALRVNSSGVVEGRFTPVAEIKDGRPQPGTDVFVRSPEGLVPEGRWTRVKLEYDRSRLALFLDGVPVATVEEQAEVWPIDEPLRLSDQRAPFSGDLDALVISAVVSEDATVLPEGVGFGADTPAVVYFDAGGALDRRAHPGALRLRLEFDDGSLATLLVGVYGTVE